MWNWVNRLLGRPLVHGDHEVGSAEAMRRKHDLYAESRTPIRIDPNDVPSCVKHLIPLAERFGEPDDLIREDIIRKASDEELGDYAKQIESLSDEQQTGLEKWLAETEPVNGEYPDAWVAFSALMMGYDCDVSGYPLEFPSKVIGPAEEQGCVLALVGTDRFHGGTKDHIPIDDLPTDCRAVGSVFYLLKDRHDNVTYHSRSQKAAQQSDAEGTSETPPSAAREGSDA